MSLLRILDSLFKLYLAVHLVLGICLDSQSGVALHLSVMSTELPVATADFQMERCVLHKAHTSWSCSTQLDLCERVRARVCVCVRASGVTCNLLTVHDCACSAAA
jgi:hypothetical protein